MPPVAWRPRRYNTLADALANAAMNHKTYIEIISDDSANILHAGSSELRLQVHSDGGFRPSDACADTAFTIVAFVTPNDRKLLYANANYIANLVTPFRSELLAFRRAIETLNNLLEQYGN